MTSARQAAHQAALQIEGVLLGKRERVRLALACLLARGHLLIEDIPGVGKTLLAHALAQTLGLRFQRIQFTSDLLPADILGVTVFERESGAFLFRPGPIFAQVVLADEVNRATPKAQSALLEAMEEGQVTVEGRSQPLPAPFFVIATQNPDKQVGVFPLPESQLDRFLMRIDLGYPDRASERELLQGEDRREILARLKPCLEPAELIPLQEAAARVHVAPALLDYLQQLLHYSRKTPHFLTGLSPRAGLALLRGAKAWAFLEGRDHVIPEDLQAVLPSVAGHRLRAVSASGVDPAEHLLSAVAIP
ncbi:MAG: AAA family ATPase [Magnetococcales bacterium]|nr:AAA family ATPase [Magnetococcales bacterium]